MKFKSIFYLLRRKLLKVIVPEFYWPKNILLDGASIKIRNMPYSFGTKRELVNGLYEINERNLINGRINEGEIVFEFGGSIGILTSLFRHYVGESGMVISIEASKKIALINESLFVNEKNVKVICGYGFPVHSLIHSINIIDFDEIGGSLGGTLNYSTSSNDNIVNNNEKIFDIKKLVEIYQKEPDILAIDIEGSERIFLEQIPNIPLSVRLILIEMHPHLYGIASMDEIVKNIVSEGFSIVEKIDHVYLFERIKSANNL